MKQLTDFVFEYFWFGYKADRNLTNSSSTNGNRSVAKHPANYPLVISDTLYLRKGHIYNVCTNNSRFCNDTLISSCKFGPIENQVSETSPQ